MNTFFSNIGIFLNEKVTYIYPLMPILTYGLLWIRGKNIEMPNTLSKKNDRDYKPQRISYKRDHSVFIGFVLCFIISLMVPLACLNAKYVTYIGKVLEKNNINILCTVSLTLTAMIFAMAFVFILKEKKYYLVFSITDVLENFNFFFCLKWVFFSCLTTCIAVISMLDCDIKSYFDVIRFMAVELSFGLNILGICGLFFLIDKIMFSSEKRELRLLDRIYQIFDMKNFDITHVKEKWEDLDAVTINIDYLYERYIKYCKKINVAKFKKITYESWLDKGEKEKRAIIQAIHRYEAYIGALVILWLAQKSITHEGLKLCSATVIQGIFFLFDAIVVFLPLKSLKIIVFRAFGDTAGYIFFDSKQRFVGETTIRVIDRKYIRYTKYIREMNSFIALIYIALLRKASPEELSSVSKGYIDKMSDEYKTTVGLLPYWVMGYLMYVQGHKADFLKKLYTDLKLDKEQSHDFRCMVYSQIYYMERKRKSPFHPDKMKYMKWLCEE